MDPLDRYKLLRRLQVLAAIGCGLILLYGLRFWFSGDSLRIVGVGILVAGASMIAGFLLGFIFGIPRDGSEPIGSGTGSDPRDAKSPQTKLVHVKPNSNLNEISDWLTKIIVGVGLVELRSIPGKLGTISYYLGIGLTPTHCARTGCTGDFIISGQTAGLAIFFLYITLGFLCGYVWTRLYFTRDLEEMEKLKREKEDLEQDNRQLWIILADRSADEQRLEEAMRYIEQALKIDPDDGRAVLTKGRILKRQAMATSEPEQRSNLLRQALTYADRAISLLPNRGEPIYNKACYQSLLGIDKKEVLSNLKTAFELKPQLRTEAIRDPDLRDVQQDEDFKRLIGEKS